MYIHPSAVVHPTAVVWFLVVFGASYVQGRKKIKQLHVEVGSLWFPGFSLLNMNQALDQVACVQKPPPLKKKSWKERHLWNVTNVGATLASILFPRNFLRLGGICTQVIGQVVLSSSSNLCTWAMSPMQGMQKHLSHCQEVEMERRGEGNEINWMRIG